MNNTNLIKALVAAQKEFKPAIKSADNPFFKSKYADLSGIWDAVKEPLNKNGLAIAQTMDVEGGENILVTHLMHTSGEVLTGKVRVKPIKDDPQSYGSAITYFRRYSLAAILGVVTEDDDGAGASGTTPAFHDETKTHQVPAPSSNFAGPSAHVIPVGRDKGKPIGSLSYEQIVENINYWKPKLDADRAAGKPVTQYLTAYLMALQEAKAELEAGGDVPL